MNPLQKASARRKVVYLAAVLALFTASIFYRGLEAKEADGTPYVWVPFGRDDPGATGPAAAAARGTILSQARRHELRELEQGDPELIGQTAQHLLLGMRGVAVTFLWYDAIDKQKRNDFHLFEKRVKAVTALQPHFITPWVFQSWNIAYNVSVEMHGLGDMYFYIARGIELLAEGEKRNRRSPDMRYWIAFYYQNKFSVSDQVQTLRCLYQLSCLPPADRDPVGLGLLNPETGEVDPAAFRAFVEKHPHLVRRLRGEERRDKDKDPRKTGSDTLRARTPLEVVDFLRANAAVPSRFKNRSELADAARQFPVLPPRFNEGPDEAHPGMPAGDDTFSAFGAARAWFAYANALVPPTPVDEAGNPVPWATPRPGPGWGEYDIKRYRVPRQPMLIIFKMAVPRSQTYQAEMEQKDGWFDATGWDVDGGVDDAAAWFTEPAPGGGRRKAPLPPVGADKAWAVQAWGKAADLWRKAGAENGLVVDESRAARYREQAGLPPGTPEPVTPPPDLTREQMADPQLFIPWRATAALYYLGSNRQVTNFLYYLAQAEAEGRPETVTARRVLWQADQARRAGNKLQAAELFEDGLNKWKKVLLENSAFHRSERFDRTEEETYEMELDYLRLVRDTPKVVAKAREEFAKEAGKVGLLLPAAVAAAPSLPDGAGREEWLTRVAEKFFSPFSEPMPAGASDGRGGTPWVREYLKDSVLIRQGTPRQPSRPSGPPPGAMPPGSRPRGPNDPPGIAATEG